jgi:hypothetical protein
MFWLAHFEDPEAHCADRSTEEQILQSNRVSFVGSVIAFQRKIPGTSWVLGSFMTPMLHLVGRPFSSSDSSTSSFSPALFPLEAESQPKKGRARSEEGVVGALSSSSLTGILRREAILSVPTSGAALARNRWGR